MTQLVTRRQKLLELITQEHHRAEHHHDQLVARQARRLTTVLRRHLAQLEADPAALVALMRKLVESANLLLKSPAFQLSQ